MKKTLALLGVAGILAGFCTTTGQAEAPSLVTQNATVNTQASINNKGIIEALNRLDGALMLAQALNIQPIEPTTYFEDISDEHQGVINALVDSGIVGSITMDYFGADEPMSRGETALWINYGFQLPTIEQSGYDFLDVNELCAQDIANIVGNKIIEPTVDTTFGIGEEVTFDQFASYLEQAISLSEN